MEHGARLLNVDCDQSRLNQAADFFLSPASVPLSMGTSTVLSDNGNKLSLSIRVIFLPGLVLYKLHLFTSSIHIGVRKVYLSAPIFLFSTQLTTSTMSPSAMPIETTSDLTRAGIKHTIAKTAPSIAINGSSSSLAELDASKLIFTRNANPKTVPVPNSPEVWSQSVYAMSTKPLTQSLYSQFIPP